MKNNNLKIFIGVIFCIIFFCTEVSLASAKLGLGELCTNNKNDCSSGDCKKSSIQINGIYRWYCNCAVGPNNVACNIYGQKDDYGKWTCIKANNITLDRGLNYCKSASGEIVYPLDASLQPTPIPNFTVPADISVAGINLVSEITLFKPVMQIKLPQAEFSDVQDTITEEANAFYIHIPWIGQYIKAIYNWSMVVASILGAVMIILQAARIVTSAGGEAKMDAYKKIARVMIGLILMWSSYFILFTINPALVEFKALKIKYMPAIETEPDAH